MIKSTLKAAVVAAALGFGAAAANAAIVPSVGGTPLANNGLVSSFSCLGGCTTFNFNDGLLPGIYSTSNGAVVTGSIPNQWAQPTGPALTPLFNNTAYLVTPAQGSSGSVTITLPTLNNYFGFYAGSIDTFNSITFFNGSTQVLQFVGSQLLALPDPDLFNGNRTQAAYFNFLLSGTDQFNRIVLASTGVAFETDNHTFGTVVIPVPGAAVLMLSGLLGMVVASRRQKSVRQAA